MDMLDSIPYRCPWCGGNQTFLSLTQLKTHLSQEHSYISGSRSRVRVFKNLPSNTPDRSSHILQSCAEDGRKLEKQLRLDKEAELNNKAQRHKSQQSFYPTPPVVPASTTHDTSRGHVIPKSPIYVPVLPFHDNHIPPFAPAYRSPVSSKSHITPKSPTYVPVLPFHDNHIKDTLNTLSHNLSMSRSSQWRTEDILYKTDNVLSGIESSADLHHVEQSRLTDELRAELAAKDTELNRVHHDLNTLRQEKAQLNEKNSQNDRRKGVEKSVQFSHENDTNDDQLNVKYEQWRNIHRQNMEKGTMEMIPREPEPDYESYMSKNLQSASEPIPDYESYVSRNVNSAQDPELQEHLLAKEQELEEVNIEMRQTQSSSMKKLQTKDKQLAKARARSEKLEQDRELLLHQMKDLLSKANINNKHLRAELKAKDKQLKKFNCELNNAKVDQKELMMETFELYKEADGSLAKLKEMLTLRDCQLKVAKEKLVQFESSNEYLQFEADTKAQQVDECELIMKTTLKTTQERLHNVHNKLQAEMSSKVNISAQMAAMEEQLKQKDITEDELKHQLEVKETELTYAKKDLMCLQSFLGAAAQKETVARSELETFISELISRVQTAEKEARALKRRIASSQESLTLSEDTTQDFEMSNVPVTVHQTLAHQTLAHQTLAQTSLTDKMSPRFSSARIDNQSVTSLSRSLSSLTDSEDGNVPKNTTFTNSRSFSKVENVEKGTGKRSVPGIQSASTVYADTAANVSVPRDIPSECDSVQYSLSVREAETERQRDAVNQSNTGLCTMVEKEQSDVKMSGTQGSCSRRESPGIHISGHEFRVSNDVSVGDARSGSAKDMSRFNHKQDFLHNSFDHDAASETVSVNHTTFDHAGTNSEQNGFLLDPKVCVREQSACPHCKSPTGGINGDSCVNALADTLSSKDSKVPNKELLTCAQCKLSTGQGNFDRSGNVNIAADFVLSNNSRIPDKEFLTCPHSFPTRRTNYGDCNFLADSHVSNDPHINCVKNTLDSVGYSHVPGESSFSNHQHTANRSSSTPSSSYVRTICESCKAAEAITPVSGTKVCVSCSKPVSHTSCKYDSTRVSTNIQTSPCEHISVCQKHEQSTNVHENNRYDDSLHTCLERSGIPGYPQSETHLASHADPCPKNTVLTCTEKELIHKNYLLRQELSETRPNDSPFPANSVCQNSLQLKIHSEQSSPPGKNICIHCNHKQEGVNTSSPPQGSSTPHDGSSVHTLSPPQGSSTPHAGSSVHTLSPPQGSSTPHAGSSVHTSSPPQGSSTPHAGSSVHTSSPPQGSSTPHAGSSVHTSSPPQGSSTPHAGSSVHTISPPQGSSTPYPAISLHQRHSEAEKSNALTESCNPMYTKESTSNLPQQFSSKMLPYAPDELSDDFSDYFALPNSTSYQSDKVHSEVQTPNQLSLKHNHIPVRPSLHNISPFHQQTDGQYINSHPNQATLITDERTRLAKHYSAVPIQRLYTNPYHVERYSNSAVLNPKRVAVNPLQYQQYQDERYHQLERLSYGAEVYSSQLGGFLHNPSSDLQHLSSRGYMSNTDQFERFAPTTGQSVGPVEDGIEFDTMATTSRRPRSNPAQIDVSSIRSRNINPDVYRSIGKLSDRSQHHRVTQHLGNVDTESEVSDSLWDEGRDADFSDSLQLSVDEDGIMWGEETDLRTLPADLYRQSPSGSETAGDVGSSLLSGSTSFHKLVSDPDFTTDLASLSRIKRRSSNTGSLSFLDEVTEEDEDSFSALPAPRRQTKVNGASVRDKLMKFLEEDSKSGVPASTKHNKDDGISVRDKLMKFLDEDSHNTADGKRKTMSGKADGKQKVISDANRTYMKSRSNDYNPNLKQVETEKCYSKNYATTNGTSSNVGRQSKQGISVGENPYCEPKPSVDALVVQSTYSSDHTAVYDNDQETSSELSSSSYTPVRNSTPRKASIVRSFSLHHSSFPEADSGRQKDALPSKEKGLVAAQRKKTDTMIPLNPKYDRKDKDSCMDTYRDRTQCSDAVKDCVMRTHGNPAQKELGTSPETSAGKPKNFDILVNKPTVMNSLDKSDIEPSRKNNVARNDVTHIKSSDFDKSHVPVSTKDETTPQNHVLLEGKDATDQNVARSLTGGCSSDSSNLLKTDKNKMEEKAKEGDAQISSVTVEDKKSLHDASTVNDGGMCTMDIKNNHLLSGNDDPRTKHDVLILKDKGNVSKSDANVTQDSSMMGNSDKTYVVSKLLNDTTNHKPASSDDTTYFQSVPLKAARQLDDTFASTTLSSSDETSGQVNKEESTDFDLESDLEKFSSSFKLIPSKIVNSKSAQDNKEESTDFDLESDLEKIALPHKLTPSGSLGSRNRSRKKKVSTQKRVQQNETSAGLLKVSQNAADESSECLSDASRSTQKQAGRKRRVALFSIFKYLDTKSLSQVARVCKEWKQVSRHPSLWKNVQLKNERISSSFLSTISHWCTQLQSLTLEGLRGRHRHQDESYEEYQRRTRGCLEPGMEELLKACQNSLTSLHIVDCGSILTDKSLWLASCYSRLLHKLKYVSSTDPVTAEVLWALVGGCPGVTSLAVPPLFPCQKPKAFNNKCLLLIGKFYRDLLELGVGGREIDINGLLPLVQGCQRLQFLALDHMKELNDDDATALCRSGLNNLSVLELNGTPVTSKAIQVIYKCCRHLKKILIQLSFEDSYDDPTNKKQRKEYSKKIHTLQALQTQAGVGNILKIHAAPLP